MVCIERSFVTEGGLGINLTAADTVIIYDSDWNPQMDGIYSNLSITLAQAMDRCHRIGQKNPVNIYRFISERTIEQHILQKATSKRKLERLVIHKNQFKGSSQYYKQTKRLDVDDIKLLLAMTEEREGVVGYLDGEGAGESRENVNGDENGEGVGMKKKGSSGRALVEMEDVLNDAELDCLMGRGDTIDGTWAKFDVIGDASDEKNNVLANL